MTTPTLPPEIEAAIDKAASDIVETGISIGRSHAYQITKTPEWWSPRLKMIVAHALVAAEQRGREAGRAEALIDAKRHIAAHAGDRAAACDAAVAEIVAAARSGGDTVGPAIHHAVSVVEVAVAASDRAKREVLATAPEVEAAIDRAVRVATRDGMGIDASNVLTAKPSATTIDARDALRAAIAAQTAREVAAARAGLRPVVDPAEADQLIDSLGRSVRDLWRSAQGSPDREQAFDEHNAARAVLLAALTGAGGGR